ncbi:hypothetical protein FRB96_006222 [Tulasnella sp. 330]|nr:hypothetical protein FRB96_006222 [Tulasnella sp. 330]
MHSVNPAISLWNEEYEDTKHRIRHIKGISIRNLTPFPKRDTVASTLTSHQTTVAAQRGLEGAYVADDADLLMAKRRTRKVSSTSVKTLRGVQQSQEAGQADPASGADSLSLNTIRVRKNSKARPPLSYPVGIPGSSASAAAITRRPRSASQASNRSGAVIPSSSPKSPTEFLFPHHFPGYSPPGSSKSSQRSLEMMVSTRLVDTLVTLSFTASPIEPAPAQSPTLDARSSPMINRSGSLGHARGASVANRSALVEEQRGSPSRGTRNTSATRSPSVTTSSSRMSRTSSFNRTLSPPRPNVLSLNDPNPSTSRASSPPPSPNPTFYVSPRCRPSTNPSWLSLDPGNEFCVSEGAQSSKISVTLWAGLDGHALKDAWMHGFPDVGGKGKGKEREPTLPGDRDPSWYSVHTWYIDLGAAQRLPSEFEEHPERLPPNTLLVSLGPTGQWHWFPPPTESQESGHISDGDELKGTSKGLVRLSPGRDALRPSRRESRLKQSAGLQDLVRLVSLQSALADTNLSKDAIMDSTDKSISDDSVSRLRKEANERELYLSTLRDDYEHLSASCQRARECISRRQDELGNRRRLLAEARGLLARSQEDITQLGSQVIESQSRTREMSFQQGTARTSLVRTIDFIYPIEPLVSGDLLFTILDVPLSLPNGPSDPAPPLSLPARPSINENSVASALGYAAHVVLLIATYLGRLLPYPITYAGSRSLVRDPISTMQGPRVFPLFSTGVETYRFEYGVFLLNKDIEILMAERDLRATDMRHTLPNIKNLLLTLTNGTSEEPKLMKRELSATQVLVDVEQEAASTSPPGSVGSNLDTLMSNLDDTTPTPRRGLDLTPRRQFLSPLTTMLRLKYANTIRQEVAKEDRTASLNTLIMATTTDMAEGPSTTDMQSVELVEQSDPVSDDPTEDLSTGFATVLIEDTGAAGNHVEDPNNDDAKTERGVKFDEADHAKANGISLLSPHGTIKAAATPPTTASGDGYGGMLSSFFWRGSGRRDVEKHVTAVEPIAVAPEGSLPSLHNAIS